MKRFTSVSIAAILGVFASFGLADARQAAAAPPPAAESNPFFSASPLPFQAPPFDRIKDSDYAPAIEEGMKRQLAEIEAIADNPEPPTFANTLEAMERSGELLTRVAKVFFNLAQSNTNETMQKIKADEAPKLAAHQDAIFLNPKLFARVKALYDRREGLGLDPEARYLVERYYLNFVRAGAQLSDADKTVLRALNQEEAKLTTEFTDKVLADTNDSAVVVADKAELAGFSEGDIAAAAETAKERGLAGKWVLSLQNTTQQPALASLAEPRAARAPLPGLVAARQSRRRQRHEGDRRAPGGAPRAAARSSWASRATPRYVLDDQMAKTPQNAEKLMTGLVPAATAKARGEAARMQKLIDAEKGGFPLDAGRLGVLRRKGPQGRVRPRRVAGQAVLRARARAAGRRLLRREQALRHHVQGAQGHPGLSARRPRLRGLRRRRQVAGALLRRLLLALEQERRRLAATASSTRAVSSGRSRSSSTSPTSRSPPRASRRCSPSTT